MSVHQPRAIRCQNCGSPFSPMQVERIQKGKSVICEVCGTEYDPSKQSLRDIQPAAGNEPRNLYRPGDLGKKDGGRPLLGHRPRGHRPLKRMESGIRRREIIRVDDHHPRVNRNNILQALSFEWKTLRQLANAIEVNDKREFYLLRMKINEMRRQGSIEVDYQVDRVLIRRKR